MCIFLLVFAIFNSFKLCKGFDSIYISNDCLFEMLIIGDDLVFDNLINGKKIINIIINY